MADRDTAFEGLFARELTANNRQDKCLYFRKNYFETTVLQEFVDFDEKSKAYDECCFKF